MSLSGPQALRALEEALRDVRREEDEIVARLTHSTELVERLREQEGELLVKLASGRFEPAIEEALARDLGSASAAARSVLDAGAAPLAEVAAQLSRIDAAMDEAVAGRAAALENGESIRADLTALAEDLRPGLADSADYAEKLATAERLSAVASESLGKTAEAEASRERNGRPYRDDPLFMYLWNAGFGTAGYRANSLVAFLDARLSAMIGFDRTRSNFAALNEIPLRLREHAVQQEELAEAAQRELTALEDAAVDAAGGRDARMALATAGEALAAADALIVSLQDQRDDLIRQQRELAQGNTPYQAALAALTAILGRNDLRALLSASRAGAGQDATVIEQIDDVRQRANEEDYEGRDHRARLKTLETRRRELEDIQFEFKTFGYDRSSVVFANDRLATDHLNEFLRGGIGAAAYWEMWRQGQSPESTTGWLDPVAAAGAGFSRPRTRHA